ncbi:Cof-type HAD-IIB family hydrolase [Clostridium sp. UBA1056]|uniref:Cof-type HAD-IIB family hydrolase n=1 Tax=unclassified Clostridium TaxID=2614128 RepID=UPI003216C25C
MKYKLICVDMDGTLLNNKKKISQRNLKAINEAYNKGARFVVATGRIFVSANYYGDIIGVKTPIIASNGAYIREKDMDRAIYEEYLNKEECISILNLLKTHGIMPQFYSTDTIYTEEVKHSALAYSKANETLPRNRQVAIRIVSQWEKLFEENINLIKVMVMDDDKDRVRVAKKDFLELKKFEVVSSMDGSFEIMKKGTSKGEAVKKICEYYGINRNEVICIGDNENDLSMIKFAGLGVAMGNAEEFVKKQADYITFSNEDDGVAHVIEEFILK